MADGAGAGEADRYAAGEAFELVRHQRRVGGNDGDDRAGRPVAQAAFHMVAANVLAQ